MVSSSTTTHKHKQHEYSDPDLMDSLIAELKTKGYVNSQDIAKKDNSYEIRQKLGELYSQDLLKSVILTDNSEKDWEKLYRIYYTTIEFRNKYGGFPSKFDS